MRPSCRGRCAATLLALAPAAAYAAAGAAEVVPDANEALRGAATGGSVSYKTFRFSVQMLRADDPDKTKAWGHNEGPQVAEFAFQYRGRILGGQPSEKKGAVWGLKNAGVTITNPGGNEGAREGIAFAIDGDLATKWYFGGKANKPVIIDFGTPTPVDRFAYATANDCPGRDPVHWTLEGSNDGQSWKQLLDAQFLPTTDRRTMLKFIAINNGPAPRIVGTPSPYSPSEGGSGGGCSGGCVFLILFFVGGFTYFAGGFAYNYVKKEQRGKEAIPNREFWQDFPALMKDGALYARNKVKGGYSTV